MANYVKAVKKYLDEQEIKYEELNDHAIRVRYNGENLRVISVNVIFDEDGEDIVQLKAWGVANFADKMASGLITCNQLNVKYRWVTFCIDMEKDVCCSLDAYIDANSCGFEVQRLILRMVSIIDETYPEFQKALRRG